MKLLPVNLWRYSRATWTLFGVLLFLIVGSNGDKVIYRRQCERIVENGKNERGWLSLIYSVPAEKLLCQFNLSYNKFEGKYNELRNGTTKIDYAIDVGSIKQHVQFPGKSGNSKLITVNNQTFKAREKIDRELICVILNELVRGSKNVRRDWANGDLFFTRSTQYFGTGKVHRWRRIKRITPVALPWDQAGQLWWEKPRDVTAEALTDCKLTNINTQTWEHDEASTTNKLIPNTYGRSLKFLEDNTFINLQRTRDVIGKIEKSFVDPNYDALSKNDKKKHTKLLYGRNA